MQLAADRDPFLGVVGQGRLLCLLKGTGGAPLKGT